MLILFATQDRRYRTEVGYGLEPILPDGKVGGFGREAVPLLKQNDYNGAVLADDDAGRRGDCTGRRRSVDWCTSARPRRREEPDKGLSVVGIILLIIIFLIVVSTPFGAAAPVQHVTRGSRRWWWWGFGGGGGGFRRFRRRQFGRWRRELSGSSVASK